MKILNEQCKIPECGREFGNKVALKNHLETYHGDMKNLRCRECGKTLSSKQNLREHIFTHTGERPYRCREPGCGLHFRQGSQLSAHKRIHVAMRAISRTEDFCPIKLTDLVEGLPERVVVLENHEPASIVELPPIIGSTSYGKIPSFPFI